VSIVIRNASVLRLSNKMVGYKRRFLFALLTFISCLTFVFGCLMSPKDALASVDSNNNYSWPKDNDLSDNVPNSKVGKSDVKIKDADTFGASPKTDLASSSVLTILTSIKSSLDQINQNISSSQDTLSKMDDKLDKVNDNQKDYWNNYVKMESKSKYPKKPFPAWQVFVDQSKSQNESLSDNQMMQFAYNLTNDKSIKSNLLAANQSGLDGTLTYPLNLGLGKSIPNASALQSSRLNTMLVLQTYKLQLVQVQALSRITQLLDVLVVNNNTAQKAQLYQLRKIHKALVKTN
jgi:hypothetical protein